jgi:cell pole-organizing protein PopZ
MTQFSSEPSMDEILASIKRIIAEEGEPATLSPPTVRMPRARREEQPTLELSEEVPDENVLELTRPIGPTVARGAAADRAGAEAPELLSSGAADASRNALSALASAAGGVGGFGGNALEGLVTELLRPMLRDWLDANLPGIIEKMVAAEIARISGRR